MSKNAEAQPLPPGTIKKHGNKYDRTSAQRQTKRRALFTHMRAALREIETAANLNDAKEIARIGFRGGKSETAVI